MSKDERIKALEKRIDELARALARAELAKYQAFMADWKAKRDAARGAA